jgi:hydroxymethylglutaryl-CoA lyase
MRAVMLPKFVKIVEVGPRDGLQNEKKPLSIQTRVQLIQKLAAAGLTTIEAGSFVSPKWVPQMEHTDQVLAALSDLNHIHLTALVPNKKGMESALAAGVKEIAVFAAASETFSQKNINCSIAESLQRFEEVAAIAHKHSIRMRGYVSCCLGCPYEGEVKLSAVTAVVKQLQQFGCYEISLGDTIGVGTPLATKELVNACAVVVKKEQLAVHFHDTYGQALANVFAALEEGINVVDSSVAGIGGCPYAPGAAGNVATEDVVYMLNGMGIETGVRLDKLMQAGEFICDELQIAVRSRAHLALSKKRNTVTSGG